MADSAKTVTLTHPDADKDLTVPEDQVDRYTLGGWSLAEDKSKTASK